MDGDDGNIIVVVVVHGYSGARIVSIPVVLWVGFAIFLF